MYIVLHSSVEPGCIAAPSSWRGVGRGVAPQYALQYPHNSPGMGGGGSLGGSPPLHTIVPICTSSSTSYLVTRVPRPIMDTRIKHKLLSRALIIGNRLRA